jgi:hypothetical protein
MRRIEWMAVGWGGLAAAIGLLATSSTGEGVRLGVVGVSFLVGGFLAGVRAEELRALHAALAAAAGYLFYAVFVLFATLADALGGPTSPGFLPGENATWGLTALVGLTFAVIGGVLASYWLRPQRRDQHRRTA